MREAPESRPKRPPEKTDLHSSGLSEKWLHVLSKRDMSLGSNVLLKPESLEKLSSAWNGLESIVTDRAFVEDLKNEDPVGLLRTFEVVFKIEQRCANDLVSQLAWSSAIGPTADGTTRADDSMTGTHADVDDPGERGERLE